MRAYQHALGKVLDGAMTMQAIDKQRNLDRFLARQQRVKKPHSDAQTAQECRTTATAYPVLAAGSVGRLEQAAQAVKAKYPGALVAVVGDNDSHGKGR